ncbi:EamA family transporter RarD [Microbacterium protaetiae]|uniref:EamA family transporter RarD n=1 Tax=Microbacterium protaetiae TaxID=2509458 RepID=A0A4V0YD02_9MICO|nr:EamA family transporter RarD [Microbacterium protaetiae]QAY59001.1 EamA family transporter RarD [Microbacterium protaetiae]
MRQTRSAATTGGFYAFAAYLLWGLFPLYFLLLLPSTPWEVVAWRVLLSLVFCVVALSVTRGWGAFARIARQPRLLGWTAAAGILIFVNWTVYLVATLTGHVIEASLGYFINPIVTVLLGVLVLRERLRRAQWVAIAIAVVAVGVIIVGYGQVPWISLALAFSFGLYGLTKNRVGGTVDAVSGLTLETAWLTPVAAGMLIWVGTGSGLTLGTAGAAHAVLLLLAGVATAVPLLLFAAATRRAPLSLIGLLQFLTPILQFVTGAVILHEAMPTERWIGFGLVWVALVVLSIDSLRAARRTRAAGVGNDVAEIA